MTLNKIEKKNRQNILIEKIKQEKNLKGVSNKFFIQMLDYNPSNFSLFMNHKDGISIERIEILENYFKIKPIR